MLTRLGFLRALGAGLAASLAGQCSASGVLDVSEPGSIQKALDAASPWQVVRLPSRAEPYAVETAIEVPERVTLLLEASVDLGASGSIELNAPGAALVGGQVSSSAYGPGWCVRVGKDDCVVDGVTFTGSARTAAVMIQYEPNPENRGTITGGAVRNCTFDGTRYGLLKQATGTDASHFKVQGNEFRNIVGGDAVEWNLGGGVGVVVSGNTIERVSRGDTRNAGIGIGFAGDAYGVPEKGAHRRFVIANNTLVGVGEGIHIESCNDFLVTGNVVADAGDTAELFGAGVVVWGSREFDVTGNRVSDSDVGFLVERGEDYSSGDFKVEGNTASGCETGYRVAASGANLSAALRGNRATRCRSGYEVSGSAEWAIVGNLAQGCSGNAWDFRPDPAVTPGVAAGAVVKDNIFADEAGNAILAVEGLDTIGYLIDSGNNFSLGISHASAGGLYYGNAPPAAVERRKGDLTLSVGPDNTGWLCTAGGSRQEAAGDYLAAGEAGDDYVVVTGPKDPRSVFAIGQRVKVPYGGADRDDLLAAIRGFGQQGSESRILLDKPLQSTVAPGERSVLLPGSEAAYKTYLFPIQGSGSPEGSVSAPVGSVYLRVDGEPGTTLYVKESGTGDTGWTAK